MFLRAQLSAQLASVMDFFITIVLAKIFGMYYVYATGIGAVCGGIVNCIVNYEWTFKTKEAKKGHVVMKYVFVWIGSVFLNTYGTYYLTEKIAAISWVENTLRLYTNDLFIFPKFIVSLLVAVFWNYYLHRVFVYKEIDMRVLFRKKS